MFKKYSSSRLGVKTLCHQRPIDVGDVLPVSGPAAPLPVPLVCGQHGPGPGAQPPGDARPLPHRHHLPLAAPAGLVQQNGQGIDKIAE